MRTRQMVVGDARKQMVRKVIAVVMRMDQDRKETKRWSLTRMSKNTPDSNP
jgi:putative lipoic acid-binding regulatory protein